MSKLRSVSTFIWSDTWFEDLTSNQKLIFIYLITNEKTNMLGIYEASIKKISFETGVKKEDVQKCLNQFESDKKVRYVENHIVLVNFLKHQKFNTNMKKSAIDTYNSLPNALKNSSLNISKETVTESFETLSNHFGMVRKIEVEVESEVESETKLEIENSLAAKAVRDSELEALFFNFWNTYDKKKAKEKVKAKFFKLKNEEIKKIFETLPAYIKSTPDKKFRKDPITYLNQNSYNDEIINPTATTISSAKSKQQQRFDDFQETHDELERLKQEYLNNSQNQS